MYYKICYRVRQPYNTFLRTRKKTDEEGNNERQNMQCCQVESRLFVTNFMKKAEWYKLLQLIKERL